MGRAGQRQLSSTNPSALSGLLHTSTLNALSSSFPTSVSGRGFFKVCKNKAAFLLRSAWSCFSFDSLDAWASFSRAAAARRSSSFCFATENKEGRVYDKQCFTSNSHRHLLAIQHCHFNSNLRADRHLGQTTSLRK